MHALAVESIDAINHANLFRLVATDFLSIHGDDHLAISPTMAIDHDTMSPGPQLSANVQCRVTRKGNAVMRNLNRRLDLTILDRNDNAPELHSSDTNISVQLKEPYYSKVSKT